MITKKRFVSIIDKIKETYGFVEYVNNYKFTGGYYVDYFPRTCDEDLCHLLEEAFDVDDDVISWFCYEIDFGEKYGEDGFRNYVDGDEWPIRNAEELYDYLVMIQELKEENNRKA